MVNIHDYIVDNYFIDFIEKKIIFHLSYEERKRRILFENFFCYHFCDELPSSIILDLEEKSISDFFIHNKIFLEEKKEDTWPIVYNSLKEIKKIIQMNNFKYYVISSSYGLNGWVLAEGVQVY